MLVIFIVTGSPWTNGNWIDPVYRVDFIDLTLVNAGDLPVLHKDLAGLSAPQSERREMARLHYVQWHLNRAAEEMEAAERAAHGNAARAHSKLAFLHNVRARELSDAALPAPFDFN